MCSGVQNPIARGVRLALADQKTGAHIKGFPDLMVTQSGLGGKYKGMPVDAKAQGAGMNSQPLFSGG
jgi:hypothetical protein